jgi:hypothetical protein
MPIVTDTKLLPQAATSTTSKATRAAAVKPHTRVSATGRTRLQMAADYERENLACARLIAADPVTYRGLQLEWAYAVLRHDRETKARWRLVA